MQVLREKFRKRLVLGMLIALFALSFANFAFASGDGGADGTVLAQDAIAAQDTPEAALAFDAAPEAEVASLWDAAQTAPEPEPVIYEFEEAEVPLAALPSMQTWAFANLLIALLCLAVSLMTLIRLPLAARRRARDEVFDEYSDYRACIFKDLLVFKLLGAGVGAASVVLFLLTENIRGAMQAANGYTWLMALILFAQVAILFVAFRNGKQLYDFDVEAGIPL